MVEASEKIETDRKTPGCENRMWRFLRKPIFHILLIIAVGLIAYSNTFDVPFHFDDYYSIVQNPVIKNLANFFLNTGGYEYNPRRFLGYLTFALNYSIGGLDVTGYHVVNLAIHIVNAILVYYLLILTFQTPALRSASIRERSSFIAVLSALFFISHPIQTQAVTYIAQRYASLATLFYLLSIAMYIQSRLIHAEEITGSLKSKRIFRLAVYYFLSIISAVLAMKTKEIAFTLPIIIALYEFMFFEGRLKRRVLYLIPVFLQYSLFP
jgi:hypothetical protein